MLTNDDTLSVDGILGSKSFSAINDINLNTSILNPIKEVQSNFYKSLAEKKPKLQVFLKGWLRRANS